MAWYLLYTCLETQRGSVICPESQSQWGQRLDSGSRCSDTRCLCSSMMSSLEDNLQRNGQGSQYYFLHSEAWQVPFGLRHVPRHGQAVWGRGNGFCSQAQWAPPHRTSPARRPVCVFICNPLQVTDDDEEGSAPGLVHTGAHCVWVPAPPLTGGWLQRPGKKKEQWHRQIWKRGRGRG